MKTIYIATLRLRMASRAQDKSNISNWVTSARRRMAS